MATTVGQHSVAAFTSPVNGTTPIDANTVRGNDNTVRVAYVDHDADPGIHVQSSTLASRPAAGTAGRKWITEDSGVYTLWFDDGTNWHPVSSENVALTVLAGENLVKGDVVKVTGWNNGQDLPEVVKTTSASDTAFAVITAAVSSGSMGYATNTGIVQDVNTAAYSVGTILYANGSGGFTSTKPTSGHYQPCAYVLRSNTNNGVYYVEVSSPRIVESSANTASTVVQRDASGNFSAGTITAGALTSTGLVTFASLKGTGATTVTTILDEDNMASDSATALATQQSIKAYVDSKVATVDTLAEVLANGNTTGANDIIVNAGQKIRTPLVAAQDGTSAITIANTTGALTLNTALADSNLATISTAGKVANSATTATSANTASAIVARDASGNFTAGTITATLSGAAPAGSLSGTTLASGVTASSLTSVGTLTSLTVSGNTGIGGANPGSGRLYAQASAAGTSLVLTDATNSTFKVDHPSSGVTRFRNGSDVEWMRESSGNVAFDTNTLYVDAANNRVGVGTDTPSATFHTQVSSGTGAFVHFTNTATANNTSMRFGANGDVGFINVTGTSTGIFAVNTFGTERLRLDASGNLGLGVTPSAWGANYRALDIGLSSFWAQSVGSAGTFISTNAFFDGTNFKYKTTAAAAYYLQAADRSHIWYQAASGTAGNNISFTQAMTLDASGNLGVGTTATAGVRLHQLTTAAIAEHRIECSDTSGVFSRWKSSAGDIGYYGQANVFIGGASSSNLGIASATGAVVFATGSTITERARITTGGYFKASNTGTYGGATSSYHEFSTDNTGSNDVAIFRHTSTTAQFGISITYTAASPNGTGNAFLTCYDNAGGSSVRAQFRSNGGLANYQANNVDLSDIRTKTDISPAASMWDKVAALEIVTYKYIDQTHDDVNLGVIAQQVETVEPVWVDSDGFGDTPEGEEPLKTVYNKDITFAAIKALQEAMARIEALEVEVAALKANA